MLGHEGYGHVILSRRQDCKIGDLVTFTLCDVCHECERCKTGLEQKCRNLSKVLHKKFLFIIKYYESWLEFVVHTFYNMTFFSVWALVVSRRRYWTINTISNSIGVLLHTYSPFWRNDHCKAGKCPWRKDRSIWHPINAY